MENSNSRIWISLKAPSRSNPGTLHRVDVYNSGDIDCQCTAGQMGKFCHHKELVLGALKKLIKLAEEVRDGKNQ